MQISRVLRISRAKLQGDRSYLLVFVADTGTYEVFLPGMGYPGIFTGFGPPSLRSQQTEKSWVMDWSSAELLALHIEQVMDTAGEDQPTALLILDALKGGGRRESACVSPDNEL